MNSATACVVIIGLLTAFLSACAPPKPSDENADKIANMFISHLARKYKLDAPQETRLFAMYEELKQNKPLRAEYVALIDQWISEVESEHMDPDVVTGLMQRKHTLDMKAEPRLAVQLTELHGTMNEKQKARTIESLNELRAWIAM